MRFIRPVEVTESRLVSTSVPETVDEYNSATTYTKGALVRSGTRIWESQKDANVGNPLVKGANWIDAYPTNRWAAFDNVNSTITSAEQITFTVRPGVLIDSFAMLNVSAVSASVVVVSDTSGEVFNRDFVLSNVVTESDFYVWFFEPIVRKDYMLATDLPAMEDVEMTVTLNGPGQKVGTFAMGNLWNLGRGLYGATVGIRDFSVDLTDDFGNQVLVRRDYSKRGRFSVRCSNVDDFVSANAKVMAEIRATNVVWIGTDKFAATIIYGWCKSWECAIDYPDESLFSLEIEGRI